MHGGSCARLGLGTMQMHEGTLFACGRRAWLDGSHTNGRKPAAGHAGKRLARAGLLDDLGLMAGLFGPDFVACKRAGLDLLLGLKRALR